MTMPLDVCILWHMHQPLYEDPASGVPAMPWVRLHALKDYYDMVEIVRATPGVQVTFNLVPALLEQLEKAIDPSRPADRWLEVTRKRPENSSEADRLFLLENFFAVNHERVFPSLPRLGELFQKSRAVTSTTPWTSSDWRDLQTTFHLAWCGETLRKTQLVRHLWGKGRAFTEQEKHALLDLQAEFVKGVIPAYREAAAAGQIELSTSPYFHPILPLLCDLSSARESSPGTPLPASVHRMPDEAREQVASAMDAFARVFGAPPAGIWPSEGSLSEETLDLLEEAGVAWTATDEDLLHASLRYEGANLTGATPLLLPYQVGGRRCAVFFRDRILSDLIGFTYASWNSAAAAKDFVDRLRAIAALRPPGMGGMIAVILDGENAWEAYPQNGAGFLGALYSALQEADDLRAVTFSRHLQEDRARGSLQRIRAGSWIRGDLLTWIGHPEKNRAWELLAGARTAFIEAGRPAAALRYLRAAEGSDWFWWFGDDHSSSYDGTFDLLFRSMLRRVYECCGRQPPEGMASPIKRHPGRRRAVEPTAPIRPSVDGRVTDYFEWLGAGLVTSSPASSVIHASGAGVRSLYYGASKEGLALRFDPLKVPFSETVGAARLVVAVTSPAPAQVSISLPGGDAGFELACKKILEALIPLEALGLAPGDRVEFTATLFDPQGEPIASFPSEGIITLRVPSGDGSVDDWSA